MGKRRYKLGLKIAAEQADIQRAAKKRGLWSSIGSTLGAALAIAVTGGAAAPLVAGAIAAGGSYAGGHLGNYAAGKTGAKLKGKGRFFSGERESLAQGVKDKIGATALKTGLQVTGMKVAGRLGGKMKLGKGPASLDIHLGPQSALKAGETAASTAGVGATATKESLWDTLFKSSDPKALAGQKGLGKLMDFQGSAVGKKLSAAKSAKLATEFADKGWIDPDLQTATSKFTDVFPDSGGKPTVAMDRLKHSWKGADVPDLMDLYKDELTTPIPTSEGIETMGIDRDYWSGGSGAGDMPLDIVDGIDQQVYDAAPLDEYTIGTTDTIQQPSLGRTPGSKLPAGQSAHMEAIEGKYYEDIHAGTVRDEGIIGTLEKDVPYDYKTAMSERYSPSTSGVIDESQIGTGTGKSTFVAPDDPFKNIQLGPDRVHEAGGLDWIDQLDSGKSQSAGLPGFTAPDIQMPQSSGVKSLGVQMPNFQAQPRPWEDLGDIPKAASRSYSLQGARDSRYKNLFGR